MPANSRKKIRRNTAGSCLAVAAALLALSAAGCGGGSSSGLSGNIAIDGSSTVYPFAQAAAEQFRAENSGVNITVGESGTGGGFEKFCAGETQITNASRPIEPEEEANCKKNGVEYTELQVALDGIAVATNPDLKVQCLTTDQLKQVWQKGSKVKALSEVDPKLPSTQLSLYGPGTDSGTFDFFTAKINGEEGNSRTDFQPSEDDNVLVTGVSGDSGGLGYFGFSYYEQNIGKLNLVAVDGGKGCVKPSKQTIQDGSYPLSRPMLMYPANSSISRPDIKAFLDYTLKNQAAISDAAKVVPMSEEQATKSEEALSAAAQGPTS